ncbi:MAG: catalase [Rhodospirillales bacterium]|nr:catalase [Rhodospirillales bacterium]
MKRSIATIALSLTVAVTGAPAFAQSADPGKIAELQRTLAGNQKARPSGAKGQCFTGTFTPAAEAVGLSKSAIFAKTSRVLARLSVGGGNPKVADATKAVNRGLSFRIDNGGSAETEFVMVNAPINFVKSPDQMLAFLQARLPGADGRPDADKIKAFTDANPETTAQGRYLAGKPVPGSWVGVSYWGIHGYTLTNAAGVTRLVKFKMVPVGGEVGLTDDEARGKPADFLVDDMKARIGASTAAFDMIVVFGRPGDEATNATQQWPDEDQRPTTRLGRLAITALEKNETCDERIFDPLNLADGVAGPTNDPLFTARQPAYAASFGQRN